MKYFFCAVVISVMFLSGCDDGKKIIRESENDSGNLSENDENSAGDDSESGIYDSDVVQDNSDKDVSEASDETADDWNDGSVLTDSETKDDDVSETDDIAEPDAENSDETPDETPDEVPDDVIVNPCDGILCSGYGDCSVENGQAVCNCDYGYYSEGLACVEKTSCGSDSCGANEECVQTGPQSGCDCKDGFVETASGECVTESGQTLCNGVVCGENMECVSSLMSESCDCADGYVWNSNKTACLEESSSTLCGSVVCMENMECVSSFMSSQCECSDGYYEDYDGNCISENDLCKSVDCGNGTCKVTEQQGGFGQSSSYEISCECNAGYVYNGSTCVEDTGQIFCDQDYDCMQSCKNPNAKCVSGECNC